MTAKGHAAVAQALAEAVTLPPPPKRFTLPPGRSLLPHYTEFDAASELTAKGSTAAHCETKMVREWLRVICSRTDELSPAGVFLERGANSDTALQYNGFSAAALTTPVFEGDSLRVMFAWSKHTQTLQVDWPKGGQLTMAFEKKQPKAKDFVSGPKPLLVGGSVGYGLRQEKCGTRECELGTGLFTPVCAQNEMNDGVLQRCR